MLTIVVASDHAAVNGGLAKVALESAIGLASRGHRVFYFAAVGPIEPRLHEAGIGVICLNQPDLLKDPSNLHAAQRGVWNRQAARAMGSLLDSRDPSETILHVHGWAKGLSPSIGPVIGRSAIPTVMTMHEYFLACPNGAFYNYRQGANCPLKPMSLACISTNCDMRAYSHKMFRVVRHAALWWLADIPGRIRHFICMSELQRSIIQPYLPPEARIYFVANPIAMEERGPCGSENNDTFLFVGRLSLEKGAVMFAEAAHRTGLKAAFVGEGCEAARIRAVLPGAEVRGWLPPDEVITAMRNARALVFPSLWYECQPLTTFEALANGLPVIVSDNCAGREAVRNEETGLWFKSGDIDDLARAMRRLADGNTAVAMGNAAYSSYWRNPISLEQHLDQLEETYARMQTDLSRSKADRARQAAQARALPH